MSKATILSFLFLTSTLFPNVLAADLEWVGENEFRLIISVETNTAHEWATVPLSMTLEQAEIEAAFKINFDEINLASICVVQYDNKGMPVKQSNSNPTENGYIPIRLNRHRSADKILVRWRVNITHSNLFAIYFSRNGHEPYKPMNELPMVGDGDFLSYGKRSIQAPISGGYNEFVDAADADGDGDIDLFVAYSGVPDKQGIFYYENFGTAKEPIVTLPKRIYDFKKDFQVIDWNKDGLIDLLLGQHVFQLNITFSKSILTRIGKLQSPASAKAIFYDWDGDGVDDLLTTQRIIRRVFPSPSIWDPTLPPYTPEGVWLGTCERTTIVFHKNSGDDINPVYEKSVPVIADGVPIELYGSLAICAGDLDGDGDNDLVAGNSFQLIYFENEDSSLPPSFRKGQLIKTSANKSPFGIYVRPQLADWDGDGRIDILLGNEDGRPTWIKNLGNGAFDVERFIIQLDPDIDFGCLSVPVICDWDADGDFDLLSGNSSGFVEYYENVTSSATQFVFSEGQRLHAAGTEIRVLAGNAGSIQGPDEATYGYTMPTVADWDEDGDLDLLLSDIKGEHHFYQNIGTKHQPALAGARPLQVAWNDVPPKPGFNWWQPEPTELVTFPRCRPAVIDWNRDGLTDYVAVDHEGFLSFYEAFIKDGEKWLWPGVRCFVEAKGNSIQISELAGRKSGRARIVFADWDGDGDMDIIHNAHGLFGDTPALLKKVKHSGWFQNLGPTDNPVFKWCGELIKRDIPRISEHSTSPEVVDFDGDGKLDLFLGGEDGQITCYHRAFIEDDMPILQIREMEIRNKK